MMKKSVVLKFMTLVLFIALLAAFVLYKSGYLNDSDKSKKQATAKDMLVKKLVDSIIHKRDLQRELRLSSSKSIVIDDLSLDDSSLTFRLLRDSIEKSLEEIEGSKLKQ